MSDSVVRNACFLARKSGPMNMNRVTETAQPPGLNKSNHGQPQRLHRDAMVDHIVSQREASTALAASGHQDKRFGNAIEKTEPASAVRMRWHDREVELAMRPNSRNSRTTARANREPAAR